MIFSTETNGFSLKQLYRRSTDVDQDTPALLIVKDVDQNVNNFYFIYIERIFVSIISYLVPIYPNK